MAETPKRGKGEFTPHFTEDEKTGELTPIYLPADAIVDQAKPGYKAGNQLIDENNEAFHNSKLIEETKETEKQLKAVKDINSKSDNPLYPSVERVFSLKNFNVPPWNYASFLENAINATTHIILKEKAEFSRIELFVNGSLQSIDYHLEDKSKRFRITSETEYVFPDPISYHGRYIPLTEIKKGIFDSLEEFNLALDSKYPGRKGVVPEEDIFKRRSKREDYELLSLSNIFSFDTRIISDIPTIFEASISLIDHGSFSQASPSIDGIIIPAIKIKAEAIDGDLGFPLKIVEKLDQIVRNSYKVGIVSYTQSFTKYS